MTAETRAARERIAAFLAERSGALTDTIACSGAGRDATRLAASDLAAVLAALDRYEAPASVERCPLCGGDAAGDALAPLCEGAPHGRSGKSEASAPRPQGRYSAVLDGDTVHIRCALCPDWQLASYPGGLDGHEAEVVEAARVHGQERHGGSDDG